jgi:hypothetical protein
MTIGIYTEIIKDIKTRLEAISGGYVQLGYKADSVTPDQEKYFIIDMTGIEEAYGQSLQMSRKTGTVTLNIRCVKSMIPDAQNKLYIDTAGVYTGLVPYVEQVLDAINTSSSVLNPQIQDSTNSIAITVGGFEYNDLQAWFDIGVTVQTKPFLINNRQQI